MLKNIVVFITFILLMQSGIFAQSGIDIYGYVQSSYLFFANEYDPYPPEGEENYNFHSMGINQLNIFLAKDLGDDFFSFVNFELINNYSSDKGFGSFNLQEAYIKWDYRDFLKVKFGLIIPQFNSLFEIYNRTPLLPYIVRPKLYDATGGNLVDIFDILPQKALLQLNGSIPVESSNIEYAFFFGNPPNKFISTPNNDLIPGYVAYGQSAVKFLSYGGRLGFNTGNIRIGFSGSFDIDNKKNIIKNSSEEIADLGDVNRYRMGADFNLKLGNLEFSGEYLIVKNSVSSEMQDSLDLWNSLEPYFIGNSFDKTFYYATLQYNFSEKLFAYVMYDYLNDKVDPFYFGLDGYYGFHLGAGYYVNDSIILKMQYIKNYARYDTGEEVIPIRKYSENNFTIGASVTF